MIRIADPLVTATLRREKNIIQSDRQPDMMTEPPKNCESRIEALSRPFSQMKRYVRWKIGQALYELRYRNFRPDYDSQAVVHGIDKHVAALAAFLERGNIELFLKRLTELSGKLLSEPLIGRALFTPELDELARKASFVLAPYQRASAESELLVHVATEVYPIGGHTKVIEDIASNLPDYQHLLIVTGMRGLHPSLSFLKRRFDELSVNVHFLQCSSRAEKARELSSLIGALRPRAVILFAHHDDSVAYAAVAGHASRRVLFLHHADHQPSLGASRSDYAHVDLTPACHAACAAHPSLHASFLSLTVKDIGTVQLCERRPMVGATCGSPQKYEGMIEFSYAQLLAGLFSSGVGRIFHVADMAASQKERICADIEANGQDSNRLVFLANTPSLATKLVEMCPDFYLTSHPLGGGKATVEALSVGLPILYVCPASRPPLLGPDMTFGTSVPVSALEQIPYAIHHLESEKSTLAKRSREIYEKHYSTKAFREGLLSAINLDPTNSGPTGIL